MKKIILSVALILCCIFVYGQPFETIKSHIGIEQDVVLGKIYGRGIGWTNKNINIKGRECRLYLQTPKTSANYIKAIKEVMALLESQEVSFFNVKNNLPFEFYFTNRSSYTPAPDFAPLYPSVEQYDGLNEHGVMVLTHNRDWSNAVRIITSIKADRKSIGYLKTRLIYAIGRVLHEFNADDEYYWAPDSYLNKSGTVYYPKDSFAEAFQNSRHKEDNFGKSLGRFAMHSKKAYVAELFMYGVYDDLRGALPQEPIYASIAIAQYFNIYKGPGCYSLNSKYRLN